MAKEHAGTSTHGPGAPRLYLQEHSTQTSQSFSPRFFRSLFPLHFSGWPRLFSELYDGCLSCAIGRTEPIHSSSGNLLLSNTERKLASEHLSIARGTSPRRAAAELGAQAHRHTCSYALRIWQEKAKLCPWITNLRRNWFFSHQKCLHPDSQVKLKRLKAISISPPSSFPC